LINTRGAEITRFFTDDFNLTKSKYILGISRQAGQANGDAKQFLFHWNILLGWG